MAEKDTIYSSTIKYNGVFNFRDFYSFCHDWLIEETAMDFITEEEYSEKIKGPEKEIKVVWAASKKLTDYFKFDFKLEMTIRGLKDVEINQDGKKIKTNNGDVKLKAKGVLVRDYAGKFEKTGFLKFIRAIYEKWIITSRIDQLEGKVAGDSDEFLAQAKAYLDLEGRK